MPKNMRAAFIRRYGDNGAVCVGPREVPGVSPRELLIEVRAAAINPRDYMLRRGTYPFRHLVVGFPKVLGSDVAGVVKKVGAQVRGLKVGDEVVAMQTTLGQMGGFAEFMCVNASAVGRKASNMSFAEAAGLGVAGLTALQALRDEARLRRGERVVVVGAVGGVGHYGVQIAKAMGAEVIGVCSEPNHELARELGCDQVIDYRNEEVIDVLASSGSVDVVFDTIGRGCLGDYRRCLRRRGRYVSTVPRLDNTRDQLRTMLRHRARLLPGPVSRTILVRPVGADLDRLAQMAEAGELRTIIDSEFELEQICEALARSESRRARGKIVLRLP